MTMKMNTFENLDEITRLNESLNDQSNCELARLTYPHPIFGPK